MARSLTRSSQEVRAISPNILTVPGQDAVFHAGTGLPADPNVFIKVELSAFGAANDSWSIPVHAYFRHVDGGWRLVGFERLS